MSIDYTKEQIVNLGSIVWKTKKIYMKILMCLTPKDE